MRYIFVEGDDDNNFVDEMIKGNEGVKIIQYTKKRKEKISNMIKTIEKMNEEYLLLADLDEKDKEARINELRKRFKNINADNIFFSIQEIEAWYLSGISNKYIKKYNIKNRILIDTQDITKEKFENLFKNNRETILQIKLNILSEYDIEKAKLRNNSLKIFLDRII